MWLSRLRQESLPVIEAGARGGQAAIDKAMDAAERAGALAIRPQARAGSGRPVHRLLQDNLPAVIDADGLRELKPFERGAATVLTSTPASWVGSSGRRRRGSTHRLEALRRAVEGFGCVVVLKGRERWSARRARAHWSRAARHRSPRPAPATCSPAWSQRSSPRGWSRGSRRPRRSKCTRTPSRRRGGAQA